MRYFVSYGVDNAKESCHESIASMKFHVWLLEVYDLQLFSYLCKLKSEITVSKKKNITMKKTG